jgi:hypothetical protein
MYCCAACNQSFAMSDGLWWQFECDHIFCSTCTESLFRSSLSDGPFPPTCCGHNTSFHGMERLRKMLSEDLCAKLDERLEELQASDRTYCSIATCSSFIRPSHISGNEATCPVCERVTCVACKAAIHTGECPDSTVDPALQQLLQTAGTEGWKRCGKCLSMIELIDGCNHVLQVGDHRTRYSCK